MASDLASADFAAASRELLEGLRRAVPAYLVRLEGELARHGEAELEWVGSLEQEIVQGLENLLVLPAPKQQEPPIGFIRRKVLEALAAKRLEHAVPYLQRRGLLPASAIDLDLDLAELHVRWGIAKARVLRPQGTTGTVR
jgi:hypothetical protein